MISHHFWKDDPHCHKAHWFNLRIPMEKNGNCVKRFAINAWKRWRWKSVGAPAARSLFKSSLLRMKCLQPHSAELFHWHYSGNSAATILATYLTMLEVVVAENILWSLLNVSSSFNHPSKSKPRVATRVYLILNSAGWHFIDLAYRQAPIKQGWQQPDGASSPFAHERCTYMAHCTVPTKRLIESRKLFMIWHFNFVSKISYKIWFRLFVCLSVSLSVYTSV